MYSTKSKERDKYFSKKPNDHGHHQKFDYQMKHEHLKNQNSLIERQNNKHLKKNTRIDIEEKNNQNLFKNMQKCNQKMQYYKLMVSLQEQKKSILEKQNYFLREQNDQLKSQIEIYKNQVKKLSKKLNKQSSQENGKRKLRQQNDFTIKIPERSTKNKQKGLKSYPYAPDKQQLQACPKCLQLIQKLEEQRDLYGRDRKYLKQQIDNLGQFLEQKQKEYKLVKQKVQKQNFFIQLKQTQIMQGFKQKQNVLKKQLTACYKAFKQKCRTVQQLQQKIDQFEEQNRRILKLLALLDQQNGKLQDSSTKYQNFTLKKQTRSRSSYQMKNKNHMYSPFYNQKQIKPQENRENSIENRRNNRKCGSIKKVQSNQ